MRCGYSGLSLNHVQRNKGPIAWENEEDERVALEK